MRRKILLKTLKYHIVNISVDAWISIKWILKKYGARAQTGFNCLEIHFGGKHCTETCGCIKYRKLAS
jgi:hypothetical protein